MSYEKPWRQLPVYTEAMRAAHHAYCHDTGCFDGDDISNPEIEAALDVLWREAFGRGMNEGQRWANKARNIERADATIERVDQLTAALRKLRPILDVGMSFQQVRDAVQIIDDALADSPKEENDGREMCKCGHSWDEHVSGQSEYCNATVVLTRKRCPCFDYEPDSPTTEAEA